MMPPGHVVVTWSVAELLQQNNSRLQLDYRLLAACALLPDFIDKPLALFLFTDSQSGQNVAHSFVPHILLLVACLLWWRRALPYMLAFNGHLLADGMWRHTETFWWPFFGWSNFWQWKFMNTPTAMLNVYLEIITRYPQVWVVELLALAVLVAFVRRHCLYHWPALKQFVRTGRLAAQ
jgi:hypothetical protein